MRIVRYTDGDVARMGVLDRDAVIPLGQLEVEYPDIQTIAAAGDVALEQLDAVLRAGRNASPLTTVRLLAPIERPGKYLAIGMNYRKHVEEAERLGVAAPTRQFWFNKQTSCIAGPFDEIDPGVTEQLDYEVELGVVIGKAAKNVREEDAAQHVFGYLVANDVSARDWQFHSPTFTIGKSFDTHGPIGPWIVTRDEIPDPHVLGLRCHVNGALRQNSDTSQMIFNVWQQIAYLSTAFTLEPGDLIATGTPEGVGIGMDPKSFLQPGDVVRCEIDGIGVIENRVARC